ncbi:MAG: YraN family protein [Hyphomicrobiaceae bacterium]
MQRRARSPFNTASSADRRRNSERRGRRAEMIAIALLTLKGYRLLGRRVKSPYGEIDIIAVRGRRLAFIEVKQRSGTDAARAAITQHQTSRIENAVEHWLARHPRYRSHRIGLDAVLVTRRCWPTHVPQALHAW